MRTLAREIMSLPGVEHYDMIRLDCEDLKHGLAEAARGHADTLLERVAEDHRKECALICKEFEHIKDRALKPPENSEELMDMVAFIGQARSLGMVKLNERIGVSACHHLY